MSVRLLPLILLIAIGAFVRAAAAEAVPAKRLSLRECVDLALENNLDIRIRRIQPNIDFFNVEASRGAYDPAFSFAATKSFRSTPGISDPNSSLFTRGGGDTFAENYSPGIVGRLPIGTQYRVSGNLNRQSGTFFPSFQYTTDLGVSISQPLLKNFRIDADRRAIAVSRLNLKIDELGLRHQIMRTITAVEQAYFELVYRRENIRVQEASLRLAERLLAENRRKVELGAMAPLDEKQAESQVAARRADMLSAQVDFETQMNSLKALMSDDFVAWAKLPLEPKDKLLALAQTFDLQESWRTGLERRPDLLQSQQSLERQDIVLRFNKNQLLPSLDLQLSYGHNGIGSNLRGGFEGIRTGSGQNYSYGVVLTIPFSNRIAKNNYRASRLEKERLLLAYKQQEQQIIVEIDNAVKAARTAYTRIDATRQARLYAEAALEAEEKKLANGKSTSFFVLQLQRDLTTARLSELRALADFNRALSNLRLSEGSTLEAHDLEMGGEQ